MGRVLSRVFKEERPGLAEDRGGSTGWGGGRSGGCTLLVLTAHRGATDLQKAGDGCEDAMGAQLPALGGCRKGGTGRTQDSTLGGRVPPLPAGITGSHTPQ